MGISLSLTSVYKRIVITGSKNKINLLFDENLDPISAKNTSNYLINNNIGNPASAMLDMDNPSLVHLTLGTQLSTSSYQHC